MSSVSLYKFNGDKRQLNKDTSHGSTLIETISGNFRGDVDILAPVIEIIPTETSTIATILSNCNYVYVADLSRYYYVTGMTCKSGNVIEMSLSIDVLMSWKSGIENLSDGIIERNEEASGSNLYLDDGEIHVYNEPHIQTYEFTPATGSLNFGSECFVLAVAGS